jgi:hypothetical protein
MKNKSKNNKIREHNRKMILKVVIAVLYFFVVIAIVLKLLVPLVLSLMLGSVALINIFPLLDINVKFFGGLIFLFIIWKIFESIAYCLIKAIYYNQINI